MTTPSHRRGTGLGRAVAEDGEAKPFTFGSLFSGCGGLDAGLEAAGMRCRWQVEKDKACNKVLERHWPGMRRHGDITTLDPAGLERVDLIAGGDPCPHRSRANRIHKSDAPDLWPDFLRTVSALRPLWVLREHVVAADADSCWADLVQLGYTALVLDCDSAEITGQSRPREYLCGVLESSGVCPGQVFYQPPRRVRAGQPDGQKDQVACCLTTHPQRYDARDNYILEPGRGTRILCGEERERLQGLEPGWTGGLPLRTRARMTGNAATKPLVEWIGRRIMEAAS